jgi:hypothetical protein
MTYLGRGHEVRLHPRLHWIDCPPKADFLARLCPDTSHCFPSLLGLDPTFLRPDRRHWRAHPVVGKSYRPRRTAAVRSRYIGVGSNHLWRALNGVSMISSSPVKKAPTDLQFLYIRTFTSMLEPQARVISRPLIEANWLVAPNTDDASRRHVGRVLVFLEFQFPLVFGLAFTLPPGPGPDPSVPRGYLEIRAQSRGAGLAGGC